MGRVAGFEGGASEEFLNYMIESIFRGIGVVFLIGCSPYLQTSSAPPHPKDPDRYPFQVIDATSCYYRSGRSVESLDPIARLDRLLLEGGHILLAHHSGEFILREGTEELNIAGLANDLLPMGTKPPSSMAIRNMRDVHLLFSEEKIAERLPAARVLRPSRPIEAVYPLERAVDLNVNQDICLLWHTKGYQHNDFYPFEIHVMDILDNPLDIHTTSEYVIAIPASRYHGTQSRFVKLLILDPPNSNYRSDQISFKLDESTPVVTTPCNIENAAQALKVGFELERNGFPLQATPFYEFAMELSSLPIFVELYNLHLTRLGN